nr:hypothetical protein BaRGS_015070 [Batillaria attramentaria]
MFLEEVSPFRELEHPNILHLLGQCTDINPMLLVLESAAYEDYLSCGNDLLPIRWMAPETLKQENGAWVAHNFSKESDIWSLGVLLWEITMMGERPYDMLTDEAVLQGVIVEKVIKLPEPDIGMAQKDRMYEVMQFCWLERSERTKVDEVHGLLQQVAVKSGTAPEGDISEFEKKWEHLMPNQRHSSVDSIDEDAAGRHTSLSSGDSDILNDLSGPDSLEDFLTVEAEPTPPATAQGQKDQHANHQRRNILSLNLCCYHLGIRKARQIPMEMEASCKIFMGLQRLLQQRAPVTNRGVCCPNTIRDQFSGCEI